MYPSVWFFVPIISYQCLDQKNAQQIFSRTPTTGAQINNNIFKMNYNETGWNVYECSFPNMNLNIRYLVKRKITSRMYGRAKSRMSLYKLTMTGGQKRLIGSRAFALPKNGYCETRLRSKGFSLWISGAWSTTFKIKVFF